MTKYKNYTFLIIALGVMLLCTARDAAAGSMDKKPYDSQGQAYSSKYYPRTPGKIYMSLKRDKILDNDQFIIKLSVADIAYEGCIKFSDLGYSVDFKPPFMDITINDYTMDLRDLGGAPHYACKEKAHTPSAAIVLNKNDLQKKEIKSIRFNAAYTTSFYDIELSDERIRLRPQYADKGLPNAIKPQKLSYIGDPLTHWFYPENTIILYLPTASHKDDTDQAVKQLAARHQLKPLQEIYPNFKSPLDRKHFYYYVSDADKFVDLPNIENGAPWDHITVDKVIYGLEGDEIERKEIPVFVKRPGADE